MPERRECLKGGVPRGGGGVKDVSEWEEEEREEEE